MFNYFLSIGSNLSYEGIQNIDLRMKNVLFILEKSLRENVYQPYIAAKRKANSVRC